MRKSRFDDGMESWIWMLVFLYFISTGILRYWG